MKMKKICAAMASILALSALCGCSSKESNGGGEVKEAKTWAYEQPTEIIYDVLGGDGTVMPLRGFWSSPREAMINGQYFAELKNDEYYASVAESGINLLHQHNDPEDTYPDTVELALSYCDKYGIGYQVTNYNLFDASGGFAGTKQLLREKILQFSQHKSFAGFYLKDEPLMGSEEGLAKSCQIFYEVAEELDMNIHLYLNCNPYWAKTFKSDQNNYVQHINKILDENPLPMLEYDIYPLKRSGFLYEWFFTNISLFRGTVMENGKAWIPFVSVSAEQQYKLPDEGELAFQVNTYLALGAKGISYFPINSPISFYDYIAEGNTVAMYDLLGNKTEVWYYVREVNKQIQAMDHYLMKSTNHGAIFNCDLPYMDTLTRGEIIESGKFRELTSVKGDGSIVGCFDYYGKTALYVVNSDMENTASVTLNFDDRYEYEVIQRGQSVNVKGSHIDLSLAEGEGAFVILK